jgi:protein gp37
MNRQGPGKIGWTDNTLSPVTGCKHNCQYGPRKKCYAHLIAERIYKEGFEPTFRPKRLSDRDLDKAPEGSKVFMCDMGDLFGEWVPEDWIIPTIEIAHAYPKLIFQFLTKNPIRYKEFDFPPNCWLGTTWDGLPFTRANISHLRLSLNGNLKFVSFEPLLACFNGSLKGMDWIIIGELTGKPHTIDEKREILGWAQDLLHQAQDLKIPVFFKNWLGTMFPQREFPKVR